MSRFFEFAIFTNHGISGLDKKHLLFLIWKGYTHMKTSVIAVIAVLGLASCAPQSPVTEDQAALAAVTCFNWPSEIRTAAAALERPARSENPMVFDFKNAKSVTVSRTGKCSRVTPTQVVSGSLIYQLPPSSFTQAIAGSPEQNGTYVLWMIAEKDGVRRFIGMKGDITVKEVPAESPQTFSGPVT